MMEAPPVLSAHLFYACTQLLDAGIFFSVTHESDCLRFTLRDDAEDKRIMKQLPWAQLLQAVNPIGIIMETLKEAVEQLKEPIPTGR